MGKISLQDLASVLVERWHLGKKEASMFVNEMFFVIYKSLDEEKIVKVKGLGTFKIIDVDDRESVNVNTGDRVLIEGHGKITFTPDALMKELVNKPFSQFETVVLNEGVDFNETIANQPEDSTTVDNDEVEDSAAPLVEFVDEPQTEIKEEPVKPVEPVKPDVPEKPEKPEAKVESEKSEPTVQELVSAESSENGENPSEETSEESGVPEASDEPDASDEPEAIEEESVFKKYFKWIGIAVLTLVVGILIGYLMGNRSNNQSQTPLEPPTEAVEKEAVKSLPLDSDSIKVGTEVEEETLEDDEEDAEDEEDTMADDETANEEKASLDKWEAMDARVRTGAYRILGTDTVVKAKAGDNLIRIGNRLLGPGMECYLEVYNGLSAGAVLSAGQEIKIPKLELKKKK